MISINRDIFEKVKSSNAQIVCVTKYWESDVTRQILGFALEEYASCFLALGENRTSALGEKKISRDKMHFVGNLQSRNLKEIVRGTSVIHSLHKFSHLQKLADLCGVLRLDLSIFLQINISQEAQKGGILPDELPAFLEAMEDVLDDSFLKIEGLSAIGAGTFTVEQKIQEFKLLRQLRDAYFPHGKISAGTSRDYEIALAEGIDIVRIGKALIEEDV